MSKEQFRPSKLKYPYRETLRIPQNDGERLHNEFEEYKESKRPEKQTMADYLRHLVKLGLDADKKEAKK